MNHASRLWSDNCSTVRAPKPGSVRVSSSDTNVLCVSFAVDGRSASGSAISENVTTIFDRSSQTVMSTVVNASSSGNLTPNFTILSTPATSSSSSQQVEARFGASPKPSCFRSTFDVSFPNSIEQQSFSRLLHNDDHGELLNDAHLQQMTFDPTKNQLAFLVKSLLATRQSLEEALTNKKNIEEDTWTSVDSSRMNELGETYPGLSGTKLVVVDVSPESVESNVVLKTKSVLNDEQCKAHPTVAYPCSLGVDGAIAFVSFDVDHPYRGLAHCFAARSNKQFIAVPSSSSSASYDLHELNLGAYVKHLCLIPPTTSSSSSSIVRVAYFDFNDEKRKLGNRPHLGCAALCVAEIDTESWTLKSKKILVDIVRNVSETSSSFPGFYPIFGASCDLIALTSSTLLVGSVCRSAYVIYSVDVDSGKVSLLTPTTGFWRFMSVVPRVAENKNNNFSFIVSHSTQANGNSLKIITINNNDNSVVPEISTIYESIPKQRHTTEILPLKTFPHQGDVIWHKSKNNNNNRRRCVVFAHGGPHATDINTFSRYFHLLLCAGFDIISVNYRGSLGWGQDAVECLMGHICDYEIQDVYTALEQCYNNNESASPSSVELFGIGGSHSGLMQCILASKNDLLNNNKSLSAAAIRNPVTDLLSMRFETDIGDWCLSESGASALGVFYGNEIEAREIMSKNNPMLVVDSVQTPILMGLGLGDLRVPPFQGRSWAKAVRFNKYRPEVRLLEYEKDGHALDSPTTETEFAIQTLMFFEKYSSSSSSSSSS